MTKSQPSARYLPAGSLTLSLIAVAGLWLAAGSSLGLWLGGFGIVSILLPGLTLAQPGALRKLVAAVVVTDVVAAVWLVATIASPPTLLDWLLCITLLYSFALACLGVSLALNAARIPIDLIAAIVTITAVAWLAAPVWLSRWMNDSIADALSRFHPLLAVNSRLTDLGIWLEHPIVYRHTVLGQDIVYALPESVWPSVFAHTLLGVIGMTAALVMRRVVGAAAPAGPRR